MLILRLENAEPLSAIDSRNRKTVGEESGMPRKCGARAVLGPGYPAVVLTPESAQVITPGRNAFGASGLKGVIRTV